MSPILVNCRKNAPTKYNERLWGYATNQLPNLLSGQVDVTRFGIHTVPDGRHFNGMAHERELEGLRLLPIDVMHFLLQPENQHLIPQPLWVEELSICFWSKFRSHGDLIVGRMYYEFGKWRQGQMSLYVPSRLGFNVAVEVPAP